MDTTGGIEETVRKKGKLVDPFIFDDLIPNILSRLPTKSVIRCRLVCKKWRDLTFDREFIDLQLKRNHNPTILVANPRKFSRLDIFALDKWWEPAETSSTLHKFPFHAGKLSNTSCALFSQAGLVVFSQENKNDYISETNFIILNPISRENVKITLSEFIRRSRICGVYFHPLLKEYCSLWVIVDLRDQPQVIHYRMLNLGSDPSFKDISNPFSNTTIAHENPLFIDNYLYWTVCPEQGDPFDGPNDIMEFDVISEKFAVIPSPVPLDTEYMHYLTHIVNIDGILSCLKVTASKITTWRLENHAEKIWKAFEYTICIPICPSFEYKWVSLDVVVDGKLPLLSAGRLVIFNIMEGTLKMNYQRRKYHDDVMLLSHQMSLASLRNCKPTIFIDEDGQVVA